jgi:hypothetical protein
MTRELNKLETGNNDEITSFAWEMGLVRGGVVGVIFLDLDDLWLGCHGQLTNACVWKMGIMFLSYDYSDEK